MSQQNTINATTWTGAIMATLGGLTATEWAALAGAVAAIGGLVVNLWRSSVMVRLERERLEREFPKSTE